MVNVKNLVLGLGIIVVFALVLWQGIEAFYPSPQYDDFCEEAFARPLPVDSPEDQVKDDYRECQNNYDSARGSHTQIVFIISLIAAAIAIILGHSLLKIEPVGSSLIASGIWAIFWGSAINWSNFSNIWRFLSLLIVLILLIWITIKFNKPKKKR